MSRSRRKNPAGGITTAESEKADKAAGHRRTRLAVRVALASGEEEMPSHRLTENPWSYGKDGKAWYGWDQPELLRK